MPVAPSTPESLFYVIICFFCRPLPNVRRLLLLLRHARDPGHAHLRHAHPGADNAHAAPAPEPQHAGLVAGHHATLRAQPAVRGLDVADAARERQRRRDARQGRVQLGIQFPAAANDNTPKVSIQQNTKRLLAGKDYSSRRDETA